MSQPRSIAVVGGGVIGLSCAWRAAAAGFAVTVYDPAPGSGASGVAGGMLAPVTEAMPGEEDVLALGSASLDRWQGFAAELAEASGRDPGLRAEGTVVVATDPGDRAETDRLAEYLTRLDRQVQTLRGRELRRLEPALGPAVRHGLSVPGDLAVDNGKLLDALLAGCRAAGVHMRRERRHTPPRADTVVLAAGAHTPELAPTLSGLIRPVKGEILRLRARRGVPGPPTRTVRAVVGGRRRYLVPRDGGAVVLGATQHEVGFDDAVTAGGVRELLVDAEQVLPALAEYELEQAQAGLRPSSPDNLPVIGTLEPGVIVATGHHRNGMLLAPLTAEAVLALLRDEPVPTAAAAADPARLARNGARKEPA